jgi:hypothetical protein
MFYWQWVDGSHRLRVVHGARWRWRGGLSESADPLVGTGTEAVGPVPAGVERWPPGRPQHSSQEDRSEEDAYQEARRQQGGKAQIAKAQDAYVVGTASAGKHEFLRSIGLDEPLEPWSNRVLLPGRTAQPLTKIKRWALTTVCGAPS